MPEAGLRDTRPQVSVIVMAYNEAPSVEAVVREITEELRHLGVSAEVLIIDDGSTDGTGGIVDALNSAETQVRVIHHPVNGGLGAVYRTGFAEARGECLTFLPADGQFPASSIGRLLAVMSEHDMVLGYLPGRQGSPVARVLSSLERRLYRALFGSLPTFQGVLMFRRRLVRDLTLHSRGRGWAVLMELILRADRAGYRIASLPTEIRPRSAGRSKVNNLRTIWANLVQVLALRRTL
jgi:glycosyltransferase involved in cell wall biosynthesis